MRAGTVAVVAAAVLAVGCGGPSRPVDTSAPPETEPTDASAAPTGETTPPPNTTSPEDTAEPAGTVIVTDDSQFGPMLFDGTGQAIYIFDKERTDRPNCYGACADAWPPVLTSGPPRPDGAVRPGLLGTTRRSDGSTQVTYAGHPLYYYAHEGKNQVLCHNVEEFGGLWLVLTPAGTPAA